MTETGDLEGKLTVTYTGLEAARMPAGAAECGYAERKAHLEKLVKGYISAASEVTLSNQPDWKSTDPPLVAEFSLKVPGWAAAAGHHVIVRAGLFGAPEQHVFDHAVRVHPIYVEYPFAEIDDIGIQLPDGWQVSSLPKGWSDSGRVVTYAMKAEGGKGSVHLTRSLAVEFVFLEAKYYQALRNYYQVVKTTDDQQVVLEATAPRAGN